MILIDKAFVPGFPRDVILVLHLFSGISGTHALYIKLICSHRKSNETIPLKGFRILCFQSVESFL